MKNSPGKRKYVCDEHINDWDATGNPMERSEFEDCTFSRCNFSGSELSFFSFEECEFDDCDFSNARINGSSFKNVKFTNCKMLGLRFDECDDFLFQVDFEHCNLALASFYGVSLKQRSFISCNLRETDFTEAKMQGCSMVSCQTYEAQFERTHLERADLRGADGITLDPENNFIKGARFSRENLEGLLSKYQIVIED